MTALDSQQLARDNERLRAQLAECEANLHALHRGEADALIVRDAHTEAEQVYILERAERAEAALRETSERLTFMARAANDALYDWDLTTGQVWSNERYREQFGPHPTGFAEDWEHWLAHVHPDDRESVRAGLTLALHGQANAWSDEYRLRRSDGSYAYVLDRALIVRAAPGRAVRLIGALLDLTGHQLIEQRLRESEEYFRQIVESTGDVFWISDVRERRVLYYSPAYERLIGRAPAEAFFNDPDNFLAIVAPEDRARVLPILIENGNTDAFDVTYQIMRPDGSRRWVRDRGFPVKDETGAVARVISVMQDVTELKQTEQQQRLLARLGEMIQHLAQPEDFLFEVARLLGEHLRVRRAFFNEVDVDADREIVHRDYCRGVPSLTGIYKLSDFSLVTLEDVKAGRTVVNADAQADPRTADLYERSYAPNGERAYVAVPLMRAGQWVATLWVSDDQPRQWTPEEVALLENVAGRAWLAAENARLTEESNAAQRERDLSLAAFRASEEQLRRALAAARAGIWEYDVARNEARWSPEMYDLFGLDHARPAPTLEEFAHLILPEERERTNTAIQAAAIRGGPFAIEFRVRRPDGQILWINSSGTVDLDAQGRAVLARGLDQDITERKQTEQAREEAETRLRVFAENIEAQIYLVDHRRQQLLYVSPGFESIFGYPVAEVMAHPDDWIELVQPEDRERVLQAYAQAEATNGFDLEYRITRRDGSQRWVRDRYFPIRDEAGVITHMGGIAEDITERKNAEAELREAQHFNQQIVEIVPSVVYVRDLRTLQNVFVNRNTAEALGYSRDEIIGLGSEFMPTVMHPDDFARLPEHTGQFETLRDGETVVFEYRLRHRDGSWRWFLSRDAVFRRDERGVPTHAIGTATDITERKLAEEKLQLANYRHRAAEEAANGFSWLWDLGTGKVTRSLNVERVTGYRRDEFAMNWQAWVDLIHPADRVARSEAEAVEVLRRLQTDSFSAEYRLRHKDGREVWVMESGQIVRDAAGEPRRVVGLTVDITERKQAEAQLRDSRERLGLALEAGRMGAWDWDRVADRQRWSPEQERLFGFEPGRGDYASAEFFKLVHPDDRERIVRNAARAETEGQEYVEDEFRVVKPDGGVMWVSSRSRLIRDASGRVVQMVGVNADITERQRAEEKLRASEARYRGLVKVSLDAILINQNDAFIFANPAAVKLWGATDREQLLGKSPFELFHPDAHGLVRERLAQLAQGRTVPGVEEKILRLDGATVEVEVTATPIEVEGGPAFMVVVRDITERKRRELNLAFLAELQEAFARLSSAEEIAREAAERIAARLNLDHCLLVEINEAANAATVFHDHHAPDLSGLEGVYRLADFHTDEERERLRAGQPVIIRDVHAAPRPAEAAQRFGALHIGSLCNAAYVGDGRWKFVLSAMHRAPHPWSPEEVELLTEVCSHLYPRLERARAEEALRVSEGRLRRLLRQSSAGIVEADAQGRMTLVNQRWGEMLGYTEAELLQMSVLDVTHPSSLDATLEAVGRLAAGGPDFQIEKNYRRKDGSIIIANSNVSALRGPNGEYQGLVAVVVDITERKRAEEALREAEERQRLALESGSMGAWVWDLQARTGVVDEKTLQLFGVDPAQWRGDPEILFDRIAPDDKPGWQRAVEEAIRNHTPYRAEFRVSLPGGATRWLAGHGRTEYDAEGEPLRMRGVNFDITERKQAEAALRDSEERFRLLVQHSAHIIWRTAPDGSFLGRQESWERFTGQSFEEYQNLGGFAAIHPEDRDRVSRLWQRVLAHPTGFESEYRLRTRAGDYRHVLSRGIPLRDPAGNILEWVGYIEDITERKQAENQLRDSERFVRSTLNSLTASVAILNADGVILDVNEAWVLFAKANGYETRSYGIGLNYLEVVRQAIAAGDRDAQPVLEGLQAVLSGRQARFEYEYPCHSPNEQRWFVLNANPLNTTRGGVVISHNDITERKQAEERLRESEARFRLMADGSPLIIWVTDAHGDIEFVNRAYLDFFGVTLAQVVGPGGWQPLVHPEDADAYGAAFATAVSEHRQFRAEARVHTANGEWRWIASYAAPRQSESGEFLGMVGSSPDITEMKQAEAALAESGERERRFREKLAALHDISLELAAAPSLDELCRRAVERGRSDLGFDRVGIFLLEAEPNFVVGTYGTDGQGHTRDERQWRGPSRTEGLNRILLGGERLVALVQPINAADRESADAAHPHALAALWDGERTVGVISTDNALTGQPITDEWRELLLLYGVTIGHLITRFNSLNAVRASEERLRLVAAATDDAIFDWDVRARRVWRNPAYADQYGLPAADDPEADFNFWAEHLHPEDREGVTRALNEAMRNGSPGCSYEYRYQRVDGSYAYVLDRTLIQRDAAGQVERVVGSMTDLTERYEWETALAESEARYRRLIELMPDAMYIQSEGVIRFINPAGAKLLGYDDPDQAIGLALLDVTHPDFRELYRARRDRIANGEAVPYVESRWLTRDGSEVAVEVGAAPLIYQGQPAGLTIARDITERKRAESESARLAAIVSSSSDAILSMSLEGVIATWNAGAERMFGYPAREIVGQSILRLVPPERHPEEDSILARLRAGESIENYETVRVTQDGRRLEVSLTISPLRDRAGRIIGASKILRDITGRKQAELALKASEERFRTIAETANEGIWQVDVEGRTQFANWYMADLFDCPPAELVGRPVTDFCFEEDIPLARERIAANLRGESEDFEFRFKRLDGAAVWVLAGTSPVRDAHGQVTGALGMFTDITARKRAADQTRFLAEATRALNESLDVTRTLQEVARMAVPEVADWCTLNLLEADGTIRLAAVAHRDPEMEPVLWSLAERYPLRPDDRSGTPRAIRTGRAELHQYDWSNGQAVDVPESLREARPHSLLIVPLRTPHRTLGALSLACTDSGRSLDEDDMNLAAEVARRAALALENAQYFRDEQVARERAEADRERIARLQAVTAALSQSLTQTQVFDAVLRASLAALGAAAGAVNVLAEDGENVEIVYALGYPEEPIRQYRRFPLAAAIPGAEVIRTGAAMWFGSQAEFAERYPQLAAIRDVNQHSASAVVPMTLHGRTIGAIGLSFAQAETFSNEDKELLYALAAQCAQALERARLYEAEQRAREQAEQAAERIAGLQTFTAKLGGTLTLDQVAEVIVSATLPLTGASAATLAVLNEAGDEFNLIALDGLEAERVREWQRFPASSATPMGDAVRRNELVLLRSLEEVRANYPFMAEQAAGGRHRAWAVVPFSVGRRTLGAMSLSFTAPREFDEADHLMLLALGRQSAQALERAQLYEAEQHSRQAAERATERITSLQNVTAALSQTLTQAQVLDAVVTESMAALGAIAGAVNFLMADDETVEVVYARGYPEDSLRAYGRYPLSTVIPAAEVIRTGQAMWFTSYSEFDNRYPRLAPFRRFPASAVLPLQFEGRTRGVLGLSFTEPRPFSDEDKELLHALAAQCAQALERARLYESEQRARAAADAAARASAFLAEASKMLAGSLDYTTTLQTAARIAIPALADYTFIWSRDGDEVRAQTWAHPDPEKAALLAKVQDSYRPRLDDPNSLTAQAFRTGQPVIMSPVPPDWSAPAGLREVIAGLGLTSQLLVPLAGREGTHGVLALLRADPARNHTRNDLALAEEFARRVALAAENARLYTETQAWSAMLEQRVAERTEALQHSQEQLRQLAAYQHRVRELERSRIAQEIHDEMGGTLTGMKMMVARMRKGRGKNAKSEELGELNELIDGTLQTVRRIASELRPAVLDSLGLLPALEWQAQEFQKRTGIACTLQLLVDDLNLDEETSTAVFRVFQESLTNVARHAQATQVVASVMREGDHIILRVQDNGRGLKLETVQPGQSLGLLGMRERIEQVAGDFEIAGEPGRGTTVLIRVPVFRAEAQGAGIEA